MDLDLLAIDQNGIEGLREESSKSRTAPVVLRCNGTRQKPQFPWKTRPQNDCIQMACVIGKIDSLTGIWLRPQPTDRKSADQFCSESDGVSRSSAKRRQRLALQRWLINRSSKRIAMGRYGGQESIIPEVVQTIQSPHICRNSGKNKGPYKI